MKRATAWALVLALQFAGCANEQVTPANMTPGVMATGGSSAIPSSTPAVQPPAAMSSAGSSAPSSPVAPTPAAGSGSAATAAAGHAAPPPSGEGTGAAGSAAVSVAQAGSSAPSAGAGGSAGSAAPNATGYKPKCLSKGAELALIGDSWINYPLGEFLAPRLAQRAQKDGALAQGEMYNDQAVAGTSLATGGVGLISDQWAPAKQAAMAAGTSVKFVVMDGGGNDVLLGNQKCLDNGQMRDQDPGCQKTVKDATMVGMMLEQKMKMDGVGQAVYFFYPHVPAGGWDVLDYSLPMAKATCESLNDEKYQCYFVDTREAFQGAGNTGQAMANLIGPDGIHPNAAGDDVLADLIWKTMKEHCMAQPASSGCCTP